MRALVGFTIGLLLIAAIMITVERVARRGQWRPFVRRAIWSDLAYWVFNPLVEHTAVPLTLALCLLPIAILAGMGFDLSRLAEGFGPLSRQPGWLQGIEMLLIADFAGYWGHRLFHGRALWRFHAVHHSTRDLFWLSAARLHPVNDVLQRVMTVVPLIALGFKPGALAGVVPCLGLYAIFLHADVSWDFGPLRGVLASPRFHRWHHSAAEEGRNRNFSGLLPLWDRLFGTFYLPAHEPVYFGIDEPVPRGLLPQLWYPFSRRRRALI